MMTERTALNLDNMRQAAADAIAFLDGVSADEFQSSAQLQNAMCLLIVGEAASRIEQRSPDFIASHADWPWREIRGLRNRIAHDYSSLDVPIIWSVVRQSFPELLAKIEALGELDPRLWPKE